MQKIGKYTGKDYTHSYNTFLCPECCWVLADETIVSSHIAPAEKCKTCTQGCPARANNLNLKSPKHIWEKAILETFRFIGHTPTAASVVIR